MSRDLHGDRSGFAAARNAFVGKQPPAETPARLRLRLDGLDEPRRPTVRSAVPVSS